MAEAGKAGGRGRGRSRSPVRQRISKSPNLPRTKRPLRKTQCSPTRGPPVDADFSPFPPSAFAFGMPEASDSKDDIGTGSFKGTFSDDFFVFGASSNDQSFPDLPRDTEPTHSRKLPLRAPSINDRRGRSHSPPKRTVSQGTALKQQQQQGPPTLESLQKERCKMSLMLGNEAFPVDDVSAFLGDFSSASFQPPDQEDIEFVSPIEVSNFPGVQTKKEGRETNNKSPKLKEKEGVTGLKKLRKMMGGADKPTSVASIASVVVAEALEKSSITNEKGDLDRTLQARRRLIQQPESQTTSATSETSLWSEETSGVRSFATSTSATLISSTRDTHTKPQAPRRTSMQKLRNLISPMKATKQFRHVEMEDGSATSFDFDAGPPITGGSRDGQTSMATKDSTRRTKTTTKNKKVKKIRRRAFEAPPAPPGTTATKPKGNKHSSKSEMRYHHSAKGAQNLGDSQTSLTLSDLEDSHGTLSFSNKSKRSNSSGSLSKSSSSSLGKKASSTTRRPKSNSPKSPKPKLSSDLSTVDDTLGELVYARSSSSSQTFANDSGCLLESLRLDTVHETQNEDSSERTSRHTSKSLTASCDSPKKSFSSSRSSIRSIPEGGVVLKQSSSDSTSSNPEQTIQYKESEADNAGRRGGRSIGRVNSIGDLLKPEPPLKDTAEKGDKSVSRHTSSRSSRTGVSRHSRSRRGEEVANELPKQRSQSPAQRQRPPRRNVAEAATERRSQSLPDLSAAAPVTTNKIGSDSKADEERDQHVSHPAVRYSHESISYGGDNKRREDRSRSTRKARHRQDFRGDNQSSRHRHGDRSTSRRDASRRGGMSEADSISAMEDADLYFADDQGYFDAYHGHGSTLQQYAYSNDAGFQRYRQFLPPPYPYRDSVHSRPVIHPGHGGYHHHGGHYHYHPDPYLYPRPATMGSYGQYQMEPPTRDDPRFWGRGHRDYGDEHARYRPRPELAQHDTAANRPWHHQVSRRGQLRRRHSIGSGHSRDSIMEEVNAAVEQEYKVDACNHCGQLVSRCHCSVFHHNVAPIIDISHHTRNHSRRHRHRDHPLRTAAMANYGGPRDLEMRLTASGAIPHVSLFDTFGIKYLDSGDRSSMARRTLDNEMHSDSRLSRGAGKAPLYQRPGGFDINDFEYSRRSERVFGRGAGALRTKNHHRGRAISSSQERTTASSGIDKEPSVRTRLRTGDDKYRAAVNDDGSLRYPRSFSFGNGSTSGRTTRSRVVDDSSLHSFAI